MDRRFRRVLFVAASLALLAGAPSRASTDDAELFEKEIRPLLVENCYKCHGAEKAKAGLRVDSRKALLEGGDSGPAVVPGDPDGSPLIVAVRQRGELKMPPNRKPRDAEVAALERWVAVGAPWPADAPAADRGDDARRKHWAFQPIGSSEPPPVRRPDWCRTPIDAFVLARLEAAGLEPSPPADRRTLIRRATYDLTGLPPTPAEVEAFASDPDPDAFAKVVERLLASPHHGEQWARHWLDLARYSDTKGYVYGREERFFVHAPAYRDWVVSALNGDLPYDRFLLLQIAADRVAPGDRPALAALGFLTLGRRFLGVTHDIIDDRIDVLTRGTMGLTVSCARCHDHKFDPIPTADYYSLYGVFQNCTERIEPLAEPADPGEASKAFRAELGKRREALRAGLEAGRAEASRRARARVADYLMAQRDLSAFPQEGFDVILGKGDLNPAFVRRWKAYLAAAARADDPIFRPWRAFAALPDGDFAARAAELTGHWQSPGTPPLNARVARAFAEPPKTIREVAERYGKLFAEVEPAGPAKAGETANNADAEALREVTYGPRSPCRVPEEGIVSTEWFFDSATVVQLWTLQGEVDRWLIQSPAAPPHAVALVDREELREPRVFRRGNPANQGDEVSRHFLSVVAGPDPKPFTEGSGRQELARAIADPANPLTARVWVNRVWAHHFGAGLVRTPSDFGLRSEPPSHPELLDWLARRLVSEGWGTKSLHRMILLSAAYQQRSDPARDIPGLDRALRADPENRLLWRANPRRLTFEEARDTLLAASGELDRRVGGRAADLFPGAGTNARRTLYGLVDRQFLPSVLRAFDFANPDLHTPSRSETTVPQQALFALNHAFLAGRAQALVAGDPGADPSESVRRLYRAAYQRDPTEPQVRAALAFLDAAVDDPEPTPDPATLAWSYGSGAVDTGAGRVTGFQALPHFNGSAWGGGPRWPDPTLGWVQLTARGGHAGNDLGHAAVRRWTAPKKARVAIRSTATHDVAAGDGVRCWVVSSRHGVLKSAELHNATAEIDVSAVEVESGDTIDFAVDFRAGLNSDQYLWAPTVREVGTAPAPTWDAARDFAGPARPRLTPWGQLAQVILMSNELMFVD